MFYGINIAGRGIFVNMVFGGELLKQAAFLLRPVYTENPRLARALRGLVLSTAAGYGTDR